MVVDFDKMFNVSKLEGDSDKPSVMDGFGDFGDFELVGHGEQTNEYCGKYVKLKVCFNVDLHNVVQLNGDSLKGKIKRHIVHNSCNRPSCPICYVSWAMRSSRKVAFILGEASKQYGKVEHVMASVPIEDYGLSFEALRGKAIKVLKSRGVLGGSLIFHGGRYNRAKRWYWSPHFHSLCFIFDGYDKCRNCNRKSNCLAGCGGFDDVAWRKFQVDRWYVKVLDPRHERRNVRKTVSYELGHCTIKKGVRNFRAVTYFGVVSYRALKISAEAYAKWEEDRKFKCEVCGSELVDADYVGVEPLITDRPHPDFKREGFYDYLQNGRVAYVKRKKRKWSSDSYED